MRLYNTLTRAVEEVVPLDDRHVRMYTCGPTVYRYAHIGNLRTFLLADLVRRALEFEGYRVTQVVNITDVGHMTDESSTQAVDKMLLAAEDEGLSPQEIAEKYTQAFLEDTAKVGIQPAHVYPKATEHIPEMLELTERLLERGHAYEVGGNVYFDVQSFPEYGKLSGNTLEQLRAGYRQDLEIDPNKRFHADFALWKKAGPGRLMKWESPWGEGFPGWHIECSAMSMKYLGERFDIHTGGVDLIFPHHEDEIAQSEGATGHQVVSLWVHGGHLRMVGQKMAKSAGNILRITDLEAAGYDPLSFRYLTFQSRYRSEMDFSEEAMRAADHHVKRLRQRVAEWGPPAESLSEAALALDRRFREAVRDDLNMPQALVVLNEAASSDLPPSEKTALLLSWDRVLGLDLGRTARERWEPPEEVRALIAERDAARAAKDFARADAIRSQLLAMGLEVMDTPAGTRVRPRV
ncbi:MAG: cysteine--tRNA ligase [Actinomycetota bacterium]|nr:MAG: cysteine--tRNA ligase [Actinomycetota bacterium]